MFLNWKRDFRRIEFKNDLMMVVNKILKVESTIKNFLFSYKSCH